LLILSIECFGKQASFFRDGKPCYGSGWVSRKHAAFAPARQSLLGFRLRSYKKRGLSLSRKGTVPFLYTVPAQPSNGFLDTQPEPIHITELQMLPFGKYFIY